jgi:hypothetical protein
VRSDPPAKKASEPPSGDQNGLDAPAVPAIALASASSRRRTQSCDALVVTFSAMNAIDRPSGASTPPETSRVPAGGGTESRSRGASTRDGRLMSRTATAATAITPTPTASSVRLPADRCGTAAGDGGSTGRCARSTVVMAGGAGGSGAGISSVTAAISRYPRRGIVAMN